MPRDRQAPRAPNDQAYGMRGDQIAAQQAIPLPREQTPGQQMAQEPQMSAMDQARAFDPGIVPLTAMSERPGEPVTAGLPVGPGPGPEVFVTTARAMRAADTLTQIAEFTGSDEMRQMAAKIRESGGIR